MRFLLVRADDFLNVNASYEQGIGDQRAVAAPRYCFGAHQRDTLVLGHSDHLFDVVGKFLGLHIVGIGAKWPMIMPKACWRALDISLQTHNRRDWSSLTHGKRGMVEIAQVTAKPDQRCVVP
jgi:hypothetical protein